MANKSGAGSRRDLSSRPANGFIDLAPFKEEAQKLFPPGHPIRESLAKEPDLIPRNEGLAKLETYVSFLMAGRVPR